MIPAAMLIASTFHHCWHSKRYSLHQGGTRSAKTYSILQALVTMACHEPLTVDVMRRYSATHEKAALPDMFKVLQSMRVPYEYNASNKVFKIADSVVRFTGADDIEKLRGPQRDVLFLNEATEFTKDQFDELNQRTAKKVILDFNPWAKSHWVYDLKTLYPGKVAFFRTTYRDNPALSAEQIAAIEAYQVNDPQKWRIYGLGERVTPEELIYPSATTCTLAGQGEVVFGIDFGSTSPTAIVRVTRHDRTLYIEEMAYERNMSTEAMVALVKSFAGKHLVYCDAAEPDRIRALNDSGVQAYAANKDVQAGISYVQGFKLKAVVNTETNAGINLHKEIDSYSWRRNRNTGHLLDEPVKSDDHLMDAMRYAVFSHWGKPKTMARSYKPVIDPYAVNVM